MSRKKKKAEEKETQETEEILPSPLEKYRIVASGRHPGLFEDQETNFFKSFYSAQTKGEAKRILKRKLQDSNC